MADGETTSSTTTGASTTEPNTGIVVRYRPGAGTLLVGDTYEHKDTIKRARPRWRWFPSIRQWGAPRTRAKALSRPEVERWAEGLTQAGVPDVQVDYDAITPASTSKPAPAAVDLDAIAKKVGITPDRWPEFGKVLEAFLAAEKQGAGSAMRRWFRTHNLHRPDDLARMHGRARGLLALEQDQWPPPPLRGTTYGREHFGGILSSLDHLPIVLELEALARRWPGRMQELTGARWRYWYDDGRMAWLARGTVRDLNGSSMEEAIRTKTATRALALEARERIETSAQQQIVRLNATLDPALYDPTTPPEEVYPKLCEIESDLARKVLKDVHGVRFDWHRAGKTDAYLLCRGETTIAEIERKADVRETEDQTREAERKAARSADARALLKVFDTVAKGGEVTPLRFNLAYWRAHPEVSKYRRKDHGLRIREDDAWVRGPKDFGFSTRLTTPVSEAEAIAALFEEVRTAAGEMAVSTKDEAKAKGSRSQQRSVSNVAPKPTEAKPAEPELTARLEYVDVATGAPTDPGELGTLSTGRVVAHIDGETVEIDEEDLIGRGSDPNPRVRRYRFDADSPADYRGQAQAKRGARATKTKTKTAKTSRAKAKAGLRTTFDSASKAAALFYEHNADYFDHVHDPWDGLRDWMDGIEVRVGRSTTHRKLAQTAAGKRILGEKHAARAIRRALAYLMGKAKTRRWEDVPWDEVDRLDEALRRYYEAPGREAGQPGIVWTPFSGTVRAEDLEAMTPEQREAIRAQEASQEIGDQLEQLREAYAQAKDCLPKDVRGVIERRIAEWTTWVKDPTEIPDYACEPDPQTAGYLCNYPSVAGELSQLRRACEDAYDPNWAAEESKAGAAGFPDTSGGEDELPPPRTASARACCSKEAMARSVAEPAASKPTTAKGSCRACTTPSKANKTAKSKLRADSTKPTKKRHSGEVAAKQDKPAKSAGRGKAATKPRTAKSAKKTRTTPAERKKVAAERRKHTTAERRAHRLQCSATAAKHEAETIDVQPYRDRIESTVAAIKTAQAHVKEHERELGRAVRDSDTLARRKAAQPQDRQLARRRVTEARCQLRIAQGALRQRRRDHQRAQTEFARALTRLERRKSVAAERQRKADRAKAEAGALAPKKA